MRVVKALAGVIAALVVLFFAVGWLLPDRVVVERGIHVARPPAEVHAVLDGFGRFNEWSPWAELDPQARYEFSGPPTGVGATLRWSGNDAVGSGRQRIVESVAGERVVTALEFDGQGEATARFLLSPRDGGTDVLWRFEADFGGSIAGRWFGLFLDRLIGADYERGLARLKALLESGSGSASSAMVDGEEIDFVPLRLLYASGTAPVDDIHAIAEALAARYGEITALMQAQGVRQVGAPLTITHAVEDGVWRFDAAIPVDRNDIALAGEVRAGMSPGGRALRFVHVGPYERLHAYWQGAMDWTAGHGYRQRGPVIAQYLSDPGEMPPEALVTHLVVPIE
ncbi:SRPBCC family protein [Rehaibacterium terrae]|jgi:effector-binding domain-containing protein|uniref:Effector-binding domain-containing protein/carbon monoxide dehydrogenase subunit G n=1 Tax=Rehaibacterium terrae TaxID=1341696 RepID=A0A7W7V7E9_9GAMM|nr:SRPBCC family protein [Rehaibacterium terrae]MBB5014583.1 effector-binding domain-containing protein/carbon monoxide dehydrogenase subunit G [Rehaibacterium terrae]